ncbi:MAG: EMC3/TMCO1 family protein [Candidatus Bathyarchaeia archaeon]
MGKKDEKLMDKVMKKQKHILQLQSKMSWQQMKVSLLFIIPLILIWQFLGGTYSTPTGPLPIAYFPGVGPNLPLPIFSVSLIWWYLMCSMLFGTIFSHLLGLIEVSE